MFTAYIRGLRDLEGHFASLRMRELRLIQLEESERVAKVMEQIYRRHAPRSRGTGGGRPRHFYEGMHGAAEPRGFGFVLQVTTDDPDLRKWLSEGTGIYGPRHHRITPKGGGRALGPIRSWAKGPGSGPYWFRSVAGMRPQHWEEAAKLEAGPAVVALGNRIGVRVVHHLAHGAP